MAVYALDPISASNIPADPNAVPQDTLKALLNMVALAPDNTLARTIDVNNPLGSVTEGGAPTIPSTLPKTDIGNYYDETLIPQTQPLGGRQAYSDLLMDLMYQKPDYSNIAGSPTGGIGEVMKQAEIYGEKSDTGARQAFDEYLKAINAPSSTEEVMKRIESDALNATLADIDRDIAKSIADIKLSGEEAGIYGAGRVSEPVMAAVQGATSSGVRSKAGARTELLKTQLAREAEKEKMVIQAYGEQFKMYPELAKLNADAKKLIVETAEAEADRIAKQQLGIAQLNSTDKNNLINNLFKQLQTMDDNELQQTLTSWKIASEERQLGRKLTSDEKMKIAQMASEEKIQGMRTAWEREKLGAEQKYKSDRETGFWEGLGQSVMSDVAGGLVGGAASGFGGDLYEAFTL